MPHTFHVYLHPPLANSPFETRSARLATCTSYLRTFYASYLPCIFTPLLLTPHLKFYPLALVY